MIGKLKAMLFLSSLGRSVKLIDEQVESLEEIEEQIDSFPSSCTI